MVRRFHKGEPTGELGRLGGDSVGGGNDHRRKDYRDIPMKHPRVKVVSCFKVYRAAALLALLAQAELPVVFGQQPTTSTQPIVCLNAGYVQGVGPGYQPTTGTGLTLNIAAGTAFCNGTVVNYAGGTLTLVANATNYVYLDSSANCAPAASTKGFTSSQIPIAIVVTNISGISSITDVRTWFTNSSNGVASFKFDANPALTGGITWTSGNGLSASQSGQNLTVSVSDASSAAKGIAQLAGDLGGTATAPTITGLQGRAVSSSAPAANQFLGWNGTQWAPTQASFSSLSGTATATQLPSATPTAQGILQLAQDLAGTAALPKVVGLQGNPVAAIPPAANQVLSWDGSAWSPSTPAAGAGTGLCTANQFVTAVNAGPPTCAQPGFSNLSGTAAPAQLPSATTTAQGAVQLAQDLGGTARAPKVVGLQGIPVSSTAPTNGQVYSYSGGSNQWVPTTPVRGTVTSVGLSAPPEFTVSSSPVTSSGTLTLNKANQSANLVYAGPSSGAAAAPTFRGLVGADLPAATTTAQGAIQLAGDLAGTATAPKVTGLQGVGVAATVPANGQCLVFSTSWGPGSCASGSGAVVLAPATSQTIQAAVPAALGLIIRGTASSTVDTFEVQDSAGNPIFGVTGDSEVFLKNANKILKADQFPGADAGLRIASCMSALTAVTGGNGGVCDARGIVGTPTLSGFTIPASVTLLLGPAFYTVSGTITVNQGGSLIGIGHASGGGTILKAANNLNSPIVHAVSSAGATNWWHWGKIENLTLLGNSANQITGDCILIDRPGEASVVRDINVKDCKLSGIHIVSSVAGFGGLWNITSGSNLLYGVNLEAIGSRMVIVSLSGDDNASLIRINGTSLGQSVAIIGLKAETVVATANNPAVLIDPTGSASPEIQIIGGLLRGAPTNTPDAIRLASGNVRLFLSGVQIERFNNGIDDQVNSQIVPVSEISGVPSVVYATDSPGLAVERGDVLLTNLARYNGDALVANRVGAIVAQANQTARSASIASTTLYTTGATGAGMYQALLELLCTTSDASGASVTATIGWTGDTIARTMTSAPVAFASTANRSVLTEPFFVDNSTAITYRTTVAGTPGSGKYAVRVRLLRIG